MKRPFGEVDASRLNSRPAPVVKFHSSLTQRGTSKCFRDRLFTRSLGRFGPDVSNFPFINRLTQLEITGALDEPRYFEEDGGIPFALSTANTCSLAAIGQESGLVRVYDHDSDPSKPTNDLFKIYPHRNAVFAVQWSLDDKRLLTAGGDQSACIIDVQTQQLISVLIEGHMSTIKDAKFDPYNAHLCATSARDGSIALWDTRLTMRTPMVKWKSLDLTDIQAYPVRMPGILANIDDAHLNNERNNRIVKRVAAPSITAMLYGPAGQLITACSSNPRLKTWDLRYLRATSPAAAGGYYPLLPTSYARPTKQSGEDKLCIGTTESPVNDKHKQRVYGVSSLAISHDRQRIYSLNRDNKVYEFVTSHPEAGPTKVFDVPGLQVGSFYCKSSINKDGFLACGNATGNPVVIDTARGRVPSKTSIKDDSSSDQENLRQKSRDCATTIANGKNVRNESSDSISCTSQICSDGHAFEATGVSWSFDSSSFASISDDQTVRLWRRQDMNTDACRARLFKA